MRRVQRQGLLMIQQYLRRLANQLDNDTHAAILRACANLAVEARSTIIGSPPEQLTGLKRALSELESIPR